MIPSTDTATRAGTHVGVGAAGTSYTYLGLPMADLVGLVTIVYLLFQIINLVPKVLTNLRQALLRRKSRTGGQHEQSD